MKYLSLFSGVGGFELGIERAYETIRSADVQKKRGGAETSQGEHEKGKRLHTVSDETTIPKKRWTDEHVDTSVDKRQPHCIGFSEIDKYATKVYQHHFPNHKNYGDITTIEAKDLPEFDLIVGGFPCQAFSIAGKRGGFDDTRGTLFFDVARIVREKQPRLLLLENVKGLLSHNKGRTFYTIISTLDELGYDVQWQVLNSKDFGVPQNRERVFIVGHLRGTPRPEVFPVGGTANNTPQKYAGSYGTPRKGVEHQNHLSKAHKQPTRAYYSDGIAPTLSAQEMSGRNNIVQLNQPTHSNDRVYGTDGVSPTLNTMQGGNRQPFVKVPEATKKGYAEATEGDSINLSVPNSKTRRGRVGKGIAQTLDTGMQQHTLQDARIRRLTPLECERLMSFPDNWTNVEGMSDTQRYKQCGNGVVANVVAEIVKRMLIKSRQEIK